MNNNLEYTTKRHSKFLGLHTPGFLLCFFVVYFIIIKKSKKV